jgi:hypothetical protein
MEVNPASPDRAFREHEAFDVHHHIPAIVHNEDLPDGTARIIYAPEIIIEARTRLAAQRAANLIAAAKTLLDGDFMTGEPFMVVPDDSANLEDLIPPDYEDALHRSVCTHWLGQSAELAAKATHRRRWTLAMVKYWLSLRTCSIPQIDHHPSYGKTFTVETDPINHAIMAQAIVTAYSAIEELELHVKASKENPSTIAGKWNPPVLADLRKRLDRNGIDDSDTITWLLRVPPTRIERKHAPPAGEPAPWSGYSVRDRYVQVVDAINYASLLRSKVSAHRSHSLTRSLTHIDVHNVQHVVRRLLLESLGFWDRLVQKQKARTKPRQS